MLLSKNKDTKKKEIVVITKEEIAAEQKFLKKVWIWNKRRRQILKKKREEPQTFVETLLSWTKTLVGAVIVVMIINGLLIASFVVPTGSMEKTVMTGDFLFVNKFIYGPSSPQVVPFLNIPLPYFRLPAFRAPERGDVIVFIYPGDRDDIKAREFQYYLKRCVAIAGDSLTIKDKKLYINGVESPLPEHGQYEPGIALSPYNKFETFPPGRGYTRDLYGPLRIPKKGDNITLNQRNWREWEIFIKREGHDVSFDGINVFIDGKQNSSYTINRDYCFGMGDNRDNSADSRYWGFVPYDNLVGTPIMVYWSWDTNTPLFNIVDKLKSIRFSRIFKFIH